jgi:hypothetical protein
MSLLTATDLLYLAVVVPLVFGAAWSIHRCGALPLLHLLDADEMLAAAVTRLVATGYGLLALGVALAAVPTASDVRGGALAAVADALAGLALVLGTLHLALIGGFAWVRRERAQRDLSPPVWTPPPGFLLPPPPVPVGYRPPFLPQPVDPWAAPRLR